jgi:hypothetical protein
VTDAEYRMFMDVVGSVAAQLTLVPIDDLLEVVAKAEALGPVLEPTTYRAGGMRRLEDQRRVLEAARTLREVALTLEIVEAQP